MQENLPKVAIIGRPNVGKSSLYNRIIGERKSIIHDKPGVTRDRNYNIVSYNKHNFLLIDTGGIEEQEIKNLPKSIRNEYIRNNSSRLLQNIIKEQVLIAIEESELVLFTVEAQAILRDDIFISSLLRKYTKTVIMVVNKVDNESMKNTDAYKFGFSKVVFVSAAHGINIYPLLDLITEHIPVVALENQKDKPINVAIIGRPNSGKSSLLNKLLGENRSIVSNIPGTTRDTISEKVFAKNTLFNFLDTAGIRKRSRVRDNVEYYSVNRAIKNLSQSDISIHLIDAEETLTEQDKKIIAIAAQKGKAIIIAINKWDLVQGNSNFLEYTDRLRFKFAIASYIPIVNMSAITGFGISKLLNLIISTHKRYQQRIDTNKVTTVLSNAQKKYSIGGRKGQLKIYYAVQINAAPPRFIVFVNKRELLTRNYNNYLINTLRASFDLIGVPIFIHAKTS